MSRLHERIWNRLWLDQPVAAELRHSGLSCRVWVYISPAFEAVPGTPVRRLPGYQIARIEAATEAASANRYLGPTEVTWREVVRVADREEIETTLEEWGVDPQTFTEPWKLEDFPL